MENLELTLTEYPSSKDIFFLTEKLNEEATEHQPALPFAIFLRDAKGEVVAGCNGSIMFGSIYTDQLWVREDHRNLGLGKQLIEKVHQYGKEKGCQIATIMTMSFQAPHFYQQLGYKVDFVRHGYDQGSSCIFLSKKL